MSLLQLVYESQEGQAAVRHSGSLVRFLFRACPPSDPCPAGRFRYAAGPAEFVYASDASNWGIAHVRAAIAKAAGAELSDIPSSGDAGPDCWDPTSAG